ncbi:hypothetical protein SNEBB_001371 [Seison nebaliae]|nr:hypothetical protein SNEBB_001371 [Seison nebaliae]
MASAANKILLRDDKFDGNFIVEALSELVGTSILACVATFGNHLGVAGPIVVGLTLLVLVTVFGGLGGAHVNPAVSIAALVAQRISVVRCGIYILMQIVGSFIGGGLARGLNSAGPFPPGVVNTKGQAFAGEMIGTFILVMTVLMVTHERFGNKYGGTAPILIGMSLAVGASVAASVSGGCLNFAVYLGPTIVARNDFSNFWIYLVAPIAGGCLAAVLSYLWNIHKKDDASIITADQTVNDLGEINAQSGMKLNEIIETTTPPPPPPPKSSFPEVDIL